MLAFVSYLGAEFSIDVFSLGEQDGEEQFDQRTRVFRSASGALTQRLKSRQSDRKLVHKFKTLSRILLGYVQRNPLARWHEQTLKKLVAEHRKRPYDIIISSYAPHEAHCVVIAFKQFFPEIPWVADMRDEMSKNPGLSPQLLKEARKVEQDVNRLAQVLSTVSSPILNDFKKLCPDVPAFLEIRNGFDHDFQRDLAQQEKGECFKLGYFGIFYGERKPGILFDAIESLQQSGELGPIELNIYGAHQNFTIPAGLKSCVNLHPPLPYREAIRAMSEQDLNVQIDPRSQRKGVFTGKIFDYISVQRPVLSLVDTEDVAAQLVREFDCGYLAECDRPDEIREALKQAYRDWQNGKEKYASTEQKNSLHRKFQVDKLNRLIRETLINP